MRDQAINQSFAFLKSKKLMPEEDEVRDPCTRAALSHSWLECITSRIFLLCRLIHI